MEAADDISYCIADVDDAVDKGILSIDKLDAEIRRIWNSFTDDKNVDPSVIEEGYLLSIADLAKQKYENERHDKKHAYILKLRTILVNDLANYAADRFIQNHEAVFHGRLDESLLDGSDRYNLATETLREISIKNVFSDHEVENLELKGYAVISGLLEIYSPLMLLSFENFKQLSLDNFAKSYPIETRLYHKLSSKHKATYHQSVEKTFEQESPEKSSKMYELYYRSRLIIDYISGMTDQFALEEYQRLSASR